MAYSVYSLSWPRAAVPVLRNGGRFPMQEHNPGLVYVAPATVALHLHDYTGRLWLGRRLVRLQPGDFTLTPAQMPSHYDLDRAGHHLCVVFESLPAGPAPVRLPLHWRPGPRGRWLGERLQEVIHLHRLGRGEGSDSAVARVAAAVTLQSLLLAIAVAVGARPETAVAAAPTRVDGVLEQVRQHLDGHYREPLDVPAMARGAGVSQNHLSRRFRARHGLTLQRYVLGRRIELARHLLTTTRMPIKAVAIEAGLGNPQYFHRQFVQTVGHSPSRERAVAERAAGIGTHEG